MIDRTELWIVIIGLGILSYAMRFVFLGLVGDRPLPDWLLRHLRYTAVSVLPALVAPLVMWPAATNGAFDPVRMGAALATLASAYYFRNFLAGMICGALVLTAAGFWPTLVASLG